MSAPALLRYPRALWRIAASLLHLAHAMGVMALRFHALDDAGRHARVRWFGVTALRRLGLQVQVHGQPRAGATLLIANHISWLDILALQAAAPHARFVSKADVLHWPLLGWLIKGAGTLFIQRERKRDAMRVVHEMNAALQRGETLAIFPEGTTGPGDRLLHFHANLLQAAISSETPVQPLLLRYTQPGQPASLAAAYIDDMTLVGSLWRVACADRLRVDIHVLPAQATRHADRRALSELLHGELERALHGSLQSGR